jgi:hypothetical protein
VKYSVTLAEGILRNVTYDAQGCFVSVDHQEITCRTAPGAGKSAVWSVFVDGQQSAQPTTDYARPSITSLSDLNGAPLLDASVDGGTQLLLQGFNFGPNQLANSTQNLLQAISFGPSGVEYALAYDSFHMIADGVVLVTLPPGCGTNLKMRMQVGDQFSDTSSVYFSYAAPPGGRHIPTHMGYRKHRHTGFSYEQLAAVGLTKSHFCVLRFWLGIPHHHSGAAIH